MKKKLAGEAVTRNSLFAIGKCKTTIVREAQNMLPNFVESMGQATPITPLIGQQSQTFFHSFLNGKFVYRLRKNNRVRNYDLEAVSFESSMSDTNTKGS